MTTVANKIKLRRFCLLLSYCGKNYSGMQRNPGAKTVEECLLQALKRSGLISEEQFIRPQLIYFQRAARTDKSVSAIRQVVSLKMPESVSDSIGEINKLLPEDIRVMGCKRVTQSFDSKNYCDNRTYSYLMPSFALCPLSEATTENYRVSDDVLKLFNSTLEGYVGTHVFHNFTSGKKFSEDSSVRVIRFMYCSEPFFPSNQNEMEFVIVRVKGQSFMMHQIRKMIGLAIAVVRGYATEDHIKRSMEEPFMDIPKAPGLGLMLEDVHFDRYNRKFGSDGHHEPIEWESQNAKIEEFKEKYIYPVVIETEKTEKSMWNWLRTLSLHTYGSCPSAVPPNLGSMEMKQVQFSLVKSIESVEAETDFPDSSSTRKQKIDETEGPIKRVKIGEDDKTDKNHANDTNQPEAVVNSSCPSS